MDNQIINNVIFHLNAADHAVPSAWLQHYGNNNQAVDGFQVIMNELIRLNITALEYDRSGSAQYLLTMPARKTIANLPKEFENKPYEYYLDEERKRNEYTVEEAFLKIESLRNDFKDYPKTKNRAKRSELLAWLAIGLSALTLLLKLMCNKPG